MPSYILQHEELLDSVASLMVTLLGAAHEDSQVCTQSLLEDTVARMQDTWHITHGLVVLALLQGHVPVLAEC